MDQESITRGFLSGLIDRYIGEVREDPGRSIRKLLDIAERTSDGPTQTICYQMMQRMAADRQSPYYEMLHHLVTHTSPRTIREFGINLGHNAWTFGAGHLRHFSKEKGMSLPWIVLINRFRTTERIPFTEINALVRRGKQSKIFAWLLMADETLDEWDLYAELFREHGDSVFGLYVPPQALSGEILEEAAEIPNLMVILDTDEPDWQECADQLGKMGFLYSVMRTVSSPEDAREVLSGSWLEEIVPYHPLMAFTLAGDSLPESIAAEVAGYMWDTRLAQTLPVLPADLISDFRIISRLVSGGEILYLVGSDSRVSEAKGSKFEGNGLLCSDLF